MKKILSLAILCLMAYPAAAATLNGNLVGDGYGPARSVQTVQTQFGDNQSELNAAYAQISGGNLWLMLTGNVQDNFNKLNIFIDTGAAGGQNVLQADANNGGNNPENDNWANQHNGFTFDTGFDANYMIIARRGFGPQFDFDFATIGGGLGAFEASGNIFSGATTGTAPSVGASGIGVSYDNSNVAGILGGTGPANQSNAILVTTGLELSIPLSALGNPAPADIKISAMINGSNHDFLSNQILGGLIPVGVPPNQGNLGGDGLGNFNGAVQGIDLNNFIGDQYFTVVPEPATLALAGLALTGMAFLRRRRS